MVSFCVVVFYTDLVNSRTKKEEKKHTQIYLTKISTTYLKIEILIK